VKLPVISGSRGRGISNSEGQILRFTQHDNEGQLSRGSRFCKFRYDLGGIRGIIDCVSLRQTKSR
jgi:hypothetical protein